MTVDFGLCSLSKIEDGRRNKNEMDTLSIEASETADLEASLNRSVVTEFIVEERGDRREPASSGSPGCEEEDTKIMDEQLVEIKTSSNNTMECPLCLAKGRRLLTLNAKALEQHCREEHVNSILCWRCSKCSKQCKGAHGLKIHEHHCKGQEDEIPAKEYQCEGCVMSFDSKSGLSQHKRAVHPVLRNEERKKESERKRRGRTSSLINEEEFQRIKALNKLYKGTRNINIRIAESFPQLTSKQISDVRRRIKSSDSETESEGDVEPARVTIERETGEIEESANSEEDVFEDALEEMVPTCENSVNTLGPGMEDISEGQYKADLIRHIMIRPDPEIGPRWEATSMLIMTACTTNCSQEYLDTIYGQVVSVIKEKSQGKRTEIDAERRSERRPRQRRKQTKAQKRRHFYARCQDLYNECPRKLADLVVTNDFSLLEKAGAPCRRDIEKLYDKLWGTEGPKEIYWSERENRSNTQIFTKEIFYPCTSDEIKRRLYRISKKSAAGVDGISSGDIKSRDDRIILAKLFNLLLLKSHFPKAWKQNRTTLIPKTGTDKSKVENWRPITIGSMISRLFSGILDKRLRAKIHQCPRQKGFAEENGCFVNVATLESVIRASKEQGGAIGVADVRKAFDTIPHAIIEKALRRKGIS